MVATIGVWLGIGCTGGGDIKTFSIRNSHYADKYIVSHRTFTGGIYAFRNEGIGLRG